MFGDALTFLVERAWAIPTLTASLGLMAGMAVGVVTRSAIHKRHERAQSDNILQALERVLRGEPREAFELLRREASEPEASPALFFALAAVLRRLEMTERSAQIHRSLLARRKMTRPDKIRAQLGLAVDYLHLGQAKQAEDLIKQLPRAVRKHPNLLTVRRSTAMAAKDWKEALESTALMVRHGKDDKEALAEVYARMGDEALVEGDTRRAQRSFKRALKRSKENLRARKGLSDLFLRSGKRKQARKQLQRVVEANPALAAHLLPVIRRTSVSRTDEERYIKFLRKLAQNEEAALWVGLEEAELLFASHNNEACRALLEKLLERYPRAVEVHELYFNFLLQNSLDSDALRHLDTYLDLTLTEIKRYRCGHCGYIDSKVFLSCPNCATFGAVSYNLV